MTDSRIEVKMFVSLIILALLIFVSFRMISGFYLNIILGGVLGIALKPFHSRLTHSFGGRKKIAALFTIILTTLLVFVPVGFIIKTAASEAVRIGENATNNLDGLEKTMDSVILKINNIAKEKFDKKNLIEKNKVVEILQSKALSIGQAILNNVTNVFAVFAGTFMTMLSIYYILCDWERIRNYIYEFSPLSLKATRRLLKRTIMVTRSAIKGNLSMIFIQGFAGGLGIWFVGIPSALLLGCLYGLAALVPFIGTGAVWMPTVLYLFISGRYTAAIFLAIWNILIVGLLDNFLMPLLVRKGARLHPFLVLVGVFGGLSLFGLVGFIIGPTIIALTLVMLEVFKEDELKLED